MPKLSLLPVLGPKNKTEIRSTSTLECTLILTAGNAIQMSSLYCIVFICPGMTGFNYNRTRLLAESPVCFACLYFKPPIIQFLAMATRSNPIPVPQYDTWTLVYSYTPNK